MILTQEGDRERGRRLARDRLADQRRARDIATLLEDLAPLRTYYSSAWQRPDLRSAAGPPVCPASCPYCYSESA